MRSVRTGARANQIVIHARQSPACWSAMLQDDFILVPTRGVPTRPVDGEMTSWTPRKRWSGNSHREATRPGSPASPLAALEVHPNVIENLLLVVHQRRAQGIIAR